MHNCNQSVGSTQKSDAVLLIGNPNVGKSVIFSCLTGKYVTISNYPGTTVEVAYGNMELEGKRLTVIDTPGINTFIPTSEDEKVTRDIVLSEKTRAIIQVADTKNLRRALLISLQLSEMGLPFVLNLNMEDEAYERGISVDYRKLSDILGVDVIPTVAIRRKGIDRLKDALLRVRKSSLKFAYDSVIEEGIMRIEDILPASNISKRFIAILILAGDQSINDWLNNNLSKDAIKKILEIRREIQSRFNESLSIIISQRRLRLIDEIVENVIETGKATEKKISKLIGDYSMHPVWGYFILLLVIYGMYKFVGELGAQVLVDLLEEKLFGEYINPLAIKFVRGVIPSVMIQDFLVGDYGIITMALTYSIAIVFPIVGTFFIAFGILEDSGYLPRLAVMVNRVFKIMGLNGKAVLPMVLGLGCDTMATLTTRILETKKERIIVTLLLALGIPCSAQLGVIMGMLGGLSIKASLIWSLTVILVIITVGYLASIVIPGRGSDFILELPPIRMPVLSNIFMKTVARIEWYLKEAVPLFILGTAMLFLMEKFGVLGITEKVASPLVQGILGLPGKATEAFIVGFLRRDYGAAGLYVMAKEGLLDSKQIVISLVTITLFVPCIANFFIIIKERGFKTACLIAAFIFPFAFAIGGILRLILNYISVSL